MKNTKREELPVLMKGNGMPVTGIRRMLIATLMNTWTAMIVISPTASN